MSLIGNKNDPKRNEHGYPDPTAYEAIKKMTDDEDERFHKLLYSIRNICDLAGYDLGERIILVDRRNGRVWR